MLRRKVLCGAMVFVVFVLFGPAFSGNFKQDMRSFYNAFLSDRPTQALAISTKANAADLETLAATFRPIQAVAQPSPEPGTLLLFGGGLIGLFGIARMRRNRRGV